MVRLDGHTACPVAAFPIFEGREPTSRQRNDALVGLLLLRAASLPDSVFESTDPESVVGMWDRVAVVQALEDIDGLPEVDHA